MRRFLSLDRDEAVCALALIALATLACLSPVHNDTWWHLAYGREMASSGGFGQLDEFSYTARGRPFPNHQWLAERLMYGLWEVGGLALLSLACGGLLVLAWVLCWRLTRGPLADRLLITAGAAAGSTLVWSIRPQVFTATLLPMVITLLAQQRWAWVPLVVLVWSNLHGGVLLGLIAIAAWTLAALLYQRPSAPRLVAVFGASLAATLCSPLGISYWPAIVASLERSRLNQLQEWRPPGWPPEQVFFWAAAVALLVLAARRWSRLRTLADRGVVLTAAIFLLSASRSLRNVAPFMMLAAPALTRLLFQDVTSARGRQSPAYAAVVAVAAGAAIALVIAAYSAPWVRLGWQPLSAADVAAIQHCPQPIYNAYAGGGPITWFVPSQPVFLDSRQDPFPPGLVGEATAIESGSDPAALFGRLGIACAVLPVDSPTGPTLAARGWVLQHRSAGMLVYKKPEALP